MINLLLSYRRQQVVLRHHLSKPYSIKFHHLWTQLLDQAQHHHHNLLFLQQLYQGRSLLLKLLHDNFFTKQ